jgi:hypothetical protein
MRSESKACDLPLVAFPAMIWYLRERKDNQNMSRIISLLLILTTISAILSGCLTVESKEYRIKLKSDLSGEATIRFVNIQSESDDTLDISGDDFHQLIELYLQGNRIENDNPGFRNSHKRLYEENGVLVGELTFQFDSLSAVRLFKYDTNSPYMYFVGSPLSSEQLMETNGVYGADWMPVVFWHRDERELFVKTRVVSEVPHRRGLLRHYKEWLASQPKTKKQ